MSNYVDIIYIIRIIWKVNIMKKKVILYFSVSFLIFISVFFVLFSKASKKETPDVSDYYQFWESTQPETESDSSYTRSVMENNKNNVKESEINETENVSVITETEFLYLDLNTASVDEFMMLKGIGEITAQKIVDYRKNFGPFYSTYEIMNVSGIGEGTYREIEPHIYVTYEKTAEEETEDVPESGELVAREIHPSENPSTRPMENVTEQTVQASETVIPVLDINTATAEDFQKLPGIDIETAENIVKLRTSIHYFQNIYELLYAENMTPEKFQDIKNYVCVK